MSQIVNVLPALPDNMPYKDYFIYHTSGSDTYRCSNFESLASDILPDNGYMYYGHRVVYDYDRTSASWIFVRNCEPFDSYSPFYDDFTLIASTVDIYNPDGSLYCSATKEDYFTSTISLISTSITSSTLTSALNDTKMIMSLLIFALIGFIAFRKSWRFLRGCIKGA